MRPASAQIFSSFRRRLTFCVVGCGRRFERRRKDGVTTFHFMGFVSFYSFFCWPDTKRLRLAYVLASFRSP